MPKICLATGCNNNVFSNKYCQRHQHLRTDEKFLAAKAKRSRVGFAPPTSKSKAEGSEYEKVARLYKIANPYCKAMLEGCTRHTTDVHHKKGRGQYLLAISTFLPVCRNCHDWIEEHPKEAKELGFSESRLS